MTTARHLATTGLTTLCTGAIFYACACPVLADSYTNPLNFEFDQLKPVSLAAPPSPKSRFGPGPEGWIKLRYTVNADGTTSNVDVLDYMPSSLSRNDTLDTVRSWTFDPATVGGEAVDWNNNIIVINFDLQEIPNISGPRFTTPYSEAQEFINDGKLDKAEGRANRNLREATFSMHDIGLGNMQLATIEMRREDPYLAHQAITRATMPEVAQLTDEELDIALQYRFSLEISLGRYMDALDTYARRAALTDIPADDPMTEQANAIKKALEGGYTLNAKARILDKKTGWFFIPSRRTFTIADVDGKLDDIKAVCNRRIVTLDFQADVEWSLPESWGECSLTVNGKEGTTFTFFEFEDK